MATSIYSTMNVQHNNRDERTVMSHAGVAFLDCREYCHQDSYLSEMAVPDDGCDYEKLEWASAKDEQCPMFEKITFIFPTDREETRQTQ